MGSITYDSTNDIIVVSGYKDTSTSPPTPWTIEDIYNADSSNGWGKTLFEKNSDDGRRVLIVKCHLKITGGGEYDGSNPTFVMDYNDALWVEKVFYVDSDTGVRIGSLDSNGYGIKGAWIASANYYDVSWINAPADWKCICIAGKAEIYGAQIYPYNGRFSVLGGASVTVIDTAIWNTARIASTNTVLRRVLFMSVGETDFLEFTGSPSEMTDVEVKNTEYLLSFYQCSGKKVVVTRPRFINCQNQWSLPDSSNAEIHVVDAVPLPNPEDAVGLRGWDMEGATVYFDFTVTVRAVDADGNPVSGAVVNIINAKGELVASGETDSDGYYSATVTAWKAVVSSSQLSDADVSKQFTYNNTTWYWNVYRYNPFLITSYKEGYEHFVLKTSISSPTSVSAVLSVTGIEFGSLAFANRYDVGEPVYLAIPLYTSDGSPVTNGKVDIRIVKPDGTVVQDWTQATHLENGVYVLEVTGLEPGFYIVEYRGEYMGLETFGADTIVISTDTLQILGAIRRHPL